MNCICKLEFVLKYIFFKEGTLERKRTLRDDIDSSMTWVLGWIGFNTVSHTVSFIYLPNLQNSAIFMIHSKICYISIIK